MPEALPATLLKLLLPLAAIVAIGFVARRRGLSPAADLGLRAPLPLPATLCLLGWVALVAAEEALARSTGDWTPPPWPAYPASIVALRVLAIGVAGPVAEELAFRGVLLNLFRRSRLGPFGAVAATAALWSLVHLHEAPLQVLLVFIDGLALGATRLITRSLYVPIAMHVGGNLFAIAQATLLRGD